MTTADVTRLLIEAAMAEWLAPLACDRVGGYTDASFGLAQVTMDSEYDLTELADLIVKRLREAGVAC